MKILLSAAVTAIALTALAGCGDDDTKTAADPASAPPSSSEPTDPPTVGTYPELDATDYSFVLEQQCYCPLTGPVKVTVEDGEITSAVIVKGGNGMKKGTEAPEYLHLTINDVIAHANDTSAAKIDVDWPEGQDWPSTVAVDQIENAVDDEVTYVIRDVQISG
jgi:hypothetical protein